MAPASHPPPSGSGVRFGARRYSDGSRQPVILIVALVGGLTVLMLGLSWLFNGSWPWQRPPHGSDEIDRDRSGEPGLLGQPFPGGGGDGGAGGS